LSPRALSDLNHPSEFRSAAGSAAIAFVVLLSTGSVADADRVVVKGDTLQGTVQSITKQEIVLETIYGDGTLVIAVEDVESIETEAPFHVLHGDDARTTGPVVGLTPDAIVVAESGAAPVEFAFQDVYAARRNRGPEANLLERAPVGLPYWSGDLERAFSATQATDATLALGAGLRLRRERGPHHTNTELTYRLSQRKLQGESNDTTANELRGFLRHEYDFAARWFAFGAADAEYDAIESLSIPMWEAISLRLSLVNLYDSTPAEGNHENSLSTQVGLSCGF
jgi:hypothetical protein